ncbi:MAG: hypothetical protein ACO1SV_25765 [Fimbriimonas sp.]
MLRTEEAATDVDRGEILAPNVPAPSYLQLHERRALGVVAAGYFVFVGFGLWTSRSLVGADESMLGLLSQLLSSGNLDASWPPSPRLGFFLAFPLSMLLLFPSRSDERGAAWDLAASFGAPLGLASYAAGVPFSLLSFLYIPWGVGTIAVSATYGLIQAIRLARGKDTRQFVGRRLILLVGIWTVATMATLSLAMLGWYVAY